MLFVSGRVLVGVSGYIGYPNFVHLLKWLTSGYIVLGMSPLLKLNVDNVGSPASDIEIGKGAPKLGALSNWVSSLSLDWPTRVKRESDTQLLYFPRKLTACGHPELALAFFPGTQTLSHCPGIGMIRRFVTLVGCAMCLIRGNFPWILWKKWSAQKTSKWNIWKSKSLKSSSSRLLQKKSKPWDPYTTASQRVRLLLFNSVQLWNCMVRFDILCVESRGQLPAPPKKTLPETDMAPCIETSFQKKTFIFQPHFFGPRLQFHASHLHRFLECIWIFHQCTWLGPRHGESCD